MDTIPSGPASTRKIASYTVGARYEAIARRHLERSGLLFIAANIKFRSGELDLIMQDGDIWVFVEVRYRRNSYFGYATDSINWHKRQRLLSAASRWLSQRQLSIDTANCRFDVLAITGNQLQWLPNAFDANGES
ncbi:YraN family protein [Budvicia diplopodorum]|uniref:YraN family protein n=1 Tax=Budvicia diplopodorum TaxID=1119056 RepID=UPI001357AE44|nr:YraN family protein [Budvicia diplopodorum]